jgi:membrane protease subunit HflC
MRNTIIIILIIVVAVFMFSSLYVVDEREQIVVTMFGKAIGKPIVEPGLKWKLPFVHHVNKFPKNLLEWDGDKGQVPTKDKTFIWVDIFARWRIKEPLLLFEKLHDESGAHRKLDDIIDAAVRNLITSHSLIEAVRNTDREMELEITDQEGFLDSSTTVIEFGRSKMCEAILAQSRPKLEDFGIELVDVGFKRINYVEDVLRKVYERMIAERKQIAEKHRSEGRGESSKINGEKEKELERIKSDAYKKAQVIRGKADAKATRIYAAAYNKDPEFYSFLKTLDLYKKSFDSTNTVIMSTRNNDFLKYFKRYTPAK